MKLRNNFEFKRYPQGPYVVVTTANQAKAEEKAQRERKSRNSMKKSLSREGSMKRDGVMEPKIENQKSDLDGEDPNEP